MNTIRTLLVVICAVVALPAVASAQQRIAITPTSGINVHPAYLQATGDLFRGHLQGTMKYSVVVIPGEGGTAELSAGQAIEAGRAAQADLVVVLHVTRLASSAKVRMAVYDTHTGQLVRLEQATAGTPDDVDPVTQRLAEALATGQSVEDTAAIDTVTVEESDPYLKMQATSVFGVKLGMVTPLNVPGGDAERAIPGIAAFWLYDMRSFLAELDLGMHQQDGDGDFYIGIGAYYPLTKKNTTAYVGGAMRWLHAQYGGDGAGGIQLAPTAGILIGRLSSVQVRGDIQYFFNTFEEEETSYDGTLNMDVRHGNAYAHGLLFNVGLGF